MRRRELSFLHDSMYYCKESTVVIRELVEPHKCGTTESSRVSSESIALKYK